MVASRLHWRLLIGTVVVLMAAVWLAPRWLPALDFHENRSLVPAPALPRHLSQLHAFRTGGDAYVADHFPARAYLITGLNWLRMKAGVSGSEKVIVGRDGWLFFDDATHLGAARNDPPMSRGEVRTWLDVLAGRSEQLAAKHIAYLVVAAPTKEVIYPQFGPDWYKGPAPDRPTEQLPRLAAQAGLPDVFYLYPAVAEAARHGPKVFDRIDTHWNAYGAYAGYAGLMTRLQAMRVTDGPRPMSDFQIQTAGDKPPRDLGLMLGVASTLRIEFPHIHNPAGEAKANRTFLTAKTDWTAPQLIDTGNPGKPVLLMTRDSFSNEILPLLYPHFTRIILAHNQDGSWRPDLIERFHPDVVVLETVEHGLRIAMQAGGPPASDAAAARVEAAVHRVPDPDATVFGPSPPRMVTELARAKPADRCSLDLAQFTTRVSGVATLALGGWIWDRAHHDDTRLGFARLQGSGIDLMSPLAVDKPRPDVAAAFHKDAAGQTGFAAEIDAERLAPGAYGVAVYRRSGNGWIVCGSKPVILPAAP
ncbi:MAG: hypothetical protein JSR98_08385 [Proteobacteria bacterium]|nr:hypothetical protein [Pseudomonadota bacterium]